MPESRSVVSTLENAIPSILLQNASVMILSEPLVPSQTLAIEHRVSGLRKMRIRVTSLAYIVTVFALAVMVFYSKIRFDIEDPAYQVRPESSQRASARDAGVSTTANRGFDMGQKIFKKAKVALNVRKDLMQNLSGLCYGLCSPNSSVSQAAYVRKSVKRIITALNISDVLTANSTWELNEVTLKPRRLSWTVAEASQIKKGGMPKLFLKLTMSDGGSRSAIFKPRLDGPLKSSTPCAGFDRYDSELATYYFRQMMDNFVETPVMIGVRLDLEHEVWPVRDQPLNNNTWITEDGRYCVRFVCGYCDDGLVVCGNNESKSILEGSLSFWATEPLERVKNPWSSDCGHKGVEKWRLNSALCPQLYLNDPFYGNRRTLLDAIDANMFDFLVGNPDRHTFEYWENGNERHIILVDNGKAFPNADVDDVGLLAAVFQCCMIRERTYALLKSFSDAPTLIARFKTFMASDPLYPFLDEPHVLAVPRRIRKAIVVIELCIEKYGPAAVLIAT